MGNTARRVLGILTLGGSFTGLVITLQQIVTVAQPALAVVLSSGFALLYAWGAWCGTRLLEGDPKAMHTSRIFWALQLPVLVSPIRWRPSRRNAVPYAVLLEALDRITARSSGPGPARRSRSTRPRRCWPLAAPS